MSGIGSWLWGNSQIDEAVDKATSELLPAGAEDIALNLEICDQIRSKTAPANYAMRALKRRLNHKNPNVQLLALGLTDICVKNGGDHFLVEIASREFMDNLVSILKIPMLNPEVKNTILRLVQNWGVSFEGKPSLSYVGQVYKTLNNEGFKFPPKDLTAANSAMVDTSTAPEWIDSEVCLRCRTAFSFTNRKHHCRNCGLVFDQQCSTKSIPLPHFGIAQDVRVCDSCYNKVTKKAEKADKGHKHSASLHSSRHRSGRELADAELQRAIQLSLQESRGVNGYRPGYVAAQPEPSSWQISEPPLVDRATQPRSRSVPIQDDDDPELRAAIEASLREANAPRPSAPLAVETPRIEAPQFSYSQSYPPGIVPPHPTTKLPNYDLDPMESDAILSFSQMVEEVQAQGGKDMSRYPSVNEVYDKANGLRPKLAMSLDDAGRKEQMLTDMHDKMSQIVKLYDNILSEQLAHPRWRAPQAPSYQPANSSYSSGYNPANGHAQWAPTAPAPAPSQYQAPQAQYASPAPSQWAPQAAQIPEPPLSPPQTYSAPLSPPQTYSTPFAQQAGPSQQTQQFAEPTNYQYSTPSAVASPSTYPQPQMQLPVSYQPQPVVPASVSQPSYSPPVAVPSSPPISRQNTISYAPAAPTVNHAYHNLGRSNTIAHPVQHQVSSPPPQPVLPVFPAAPTAPIFPAAPSAIPQSYGMYSQPVQQPERQEALLIDL
ncbi:vacuolar sorting-associated protein Vps27 [Mycena floridula]|nr:vacuolar sorting-associated protein Vps27 [Mycena floridula]